MSLNGRLRNSEIGGRKEIRQPFANPSPTFSANLLCQSVTRVGGEELDLVRILRADQDQKTCSVKNLEQ